MAFVCSTSDVFFSECKPESAKLFVAIMEGFGMGTQGQGEKFTIARIPQLMIYSERNGGMRIERGRCNIWQISVFQIIGFASGWRPTPLKHI